MTQTHHTPAMSEGFSPLLLGTHRTGRLLWLKPDGTLGWSWSGQEVMWPLAECNSAGFLAWACEQIWSGEIRRPALAAGGQQ